MPLSSVTNRNFISLQYEQITVCPRSSDLFYIVIYYITRVTTSWTVDAYPVGPEGGGGSFPYLCLCLGGKAISKLHATALTPNGW